MVSKKDKNSNKIHKLRIKKFEKAMEGIKDHESISYKKEMELKGKNMTLGKRIKAARLKKGLTQDQLSELVHESRVTISDYERDKRGIIRPNAVFIIKLSKALDVTTDWLLMGEYDK